MAKKQKQQSFKRSNDLPTPPWIQIINTLDTSNVYAEALCSLIPHSHVHDSSETLSSLFHSDCKTVSIWTKFSISANRAANMARDCQNAAMKRGCNMASITLCNDSTFKDFMAVAEKDWPANHVNIQVDGTPADEVGKQILRWLFTVLSVRETLNLIPESEMLATDMFNYPNYKYCSLREARKHHQAARIQFVALIASKPEITESNKLTWKVVDRSGEATFYFHHRGPNSQHTWDWVLSLRVGDRKVLPRMPIIPLYEPIAKKILLSPLRATGATIRGVGHVAVGLGRGVHWVGEKVSVRRSDEDKYISQADWEEDLIKTEEEALKKERQKKINTGRLTECNEVGSLDASVHETGTEKDNHRAEDHDCGFKIFNEKGEKHWSGPEDDQASTVAASLVDEKVEKEFC